MVNKDGKKMVDFKWCAACEKQIDYTVEEKVEQGWMEWAIEPVKNMFACSLECEHVVVFDLM
tara:strand:- start:3882 stop:4067 length:186 start_codon:yes stop_codon:yes gene_type:complete